MTSLQHEVSLPTLAKLGIEQPPENIDAHAVATAWFKEFSNAIASNNPDAVVALFLEDGLWRDMLPLTWNFRTIHGVARIRNLLEARLAQAKFDKLCLSSDRDRRPSVFNAITDICWVQGLFDFETAVGICSGVFRIVPTSNSEWKAHVVYTNLEHLKENPYKVGPLRYAEPNHGLWLDQRAKEIAFNDSDPKVLIVGGGQSGLDIATRLKYQDIPSLIVERHSRIGDNWRKRYQALCLHDPVYHNHMPYMNFPPTWPVYTPAHKLADWLESYAHTMELNIWTSSSVEIIDRDDVKDEWIVTVIKSDGSTRIMRPKHVVMAFGIDETRPKFPDIPGMDQFQGDMFHSLQFKEASDHVGKKVVVVGACTSAHDISQDFQRNGIDVTMVQRSSTCVISLKKGAPLFFSGLYEEGGLPTEIADRIGASFPIHLTKLLHQRTMKLIMEYDKETLEGLEKVGFQLNYGEDDSGYVSIAWKRRGGYYLDAGASQLIIDGKIKFKHGAIKNFTEDSLVFDDETSLKADLVVFATGLDETIVTASRLLKGELASKLRTIWGLSDEGEINGLFRDCGLPNLWFMMGSLALCRFHSTHLALQIKAKELGLEISPYEE